MAVVLSELKVELETDPNGYGYAAHIAAGSTEPLAAELNLMRVDMPISVRMATRELMNRALHIPIEWPALSPLNRNLRNTFTRQDIDIIAAPGMKAQIEALFLPGSATVFGLQHEVWQRDGTRAEQLWGEKTVVTWQECAAALDLP